MRSGIRDRPRRAVVLSGMAILLVSLLRTAWVSDDAYISFRTADNIIHGYGAVWNVDERVQTYTHPLWLAVCTPAFALTGDVYYTAITLGVLLTLACAMLIAGRLASTSWNLLVCFAAMLSSKAFIDFSTSGLENALTHLLLLVYLWFWWNEPEGTRRVRRLSCVTALCLLNRMDLAPLLAPALAVEAWRLGPRAAIRPVLVGMLPFIAWEVFSTFYYGTPFPNTAYAKLNTIMPAGVRWRRGVDYFHRVLTGDPSTLPVIALAPFAISGARRRRDWPLVAGIGFFCVYVLRVGGDWMMGRFLTAPFVLSVGILARAAWLQSRRAALLTAAGVVALGLLATWEPALLSGYGYSYANNLLHGNRTRAPLDNETKTFLMGVMDERRYYYETTGLLKRHGGQFTDHEWAVDGRRLRASGGRVVVRSNIGLVGYFAGPSVHIIDNLALADPLLARIPGGAPASEIGHFPRPIPEGYVETISTNTNHLADPDLAAYYERLRLIIAGPLWSGHRLVTIASFLAGRYDHYVTSYVGRMAERTRPGASGLIG